MRITISAFVAGLIFAIGLGIGGMTKPSRVVGFLDVFGNWDPSLLFVMVSALVVHIFLYRNILKRRTPVFADNFQIPTRRDINLKLVIGSTLFGIGWGLAGLCPAPSIVAMASLQFSPFVFVASMVVGMAISSYVQRGQT